VNILINSPLCPSSLEPLSLSFQLPTEIPPANRKHVLKKKNFLLRSNERPNKCYEMMSSKNILNEQKIHLTTLLEKPQWDQCRFDQPFCLKRRKGLYIK
jgi:hypothetical protein